MAAAAATQPDKTGRGNAPAPDRSTMLFALQGHLDGEAYAPARRQQVCRPCRAVGPRDDRGDRAFPCPELFWPLRGNGHQSVGGPLLHARRRRRDTPEVPVRLRLMASFPCTTARCLDRKVDSPLFLSLRSRPRSIPHLEVDS
jgi:hypothetical protein